MDPTAFTTLAGFSSALFAWLAGARGQSKETAEFAMLEAILPAVVDSIRCYA